MFAGKPKSAKKMAIIPEESPQGLQNLFKKAGLNLSPSQFDKFWRLHELLTNRNSALDLTRVKGFVNLVYKHYIDCAQVARMIDPPGPLLDLGSGAGFPGLPLAVMRPDWDLILAEPRGKRLAFMEEAVEALGLKNVTFYPHKVGPSFNRPIASLITRDFEPAVSTLERGIDMIAPGGQVILMKGPQVAEELAEAKQSEAWGGYELLDDHHYELKGSPLKRRLLVFERIRSEDLPNRIHDDFFDDFKVSEVASAQNPRYKTWLKILDGRGVKKHGLALMSGLKAVSEMMANFPEKIRGLVAVRPDDLSRLKTPPPQGLEIFLLRSELFKTLDLFGTGSPLILVEPPQMEPWNGELETGATLFLPFQDPANLGAAIRTAAALEAKVVVLKEAAGPGHPKSLRASGPAVYQARLYEGPGLNDLINSPLPLWALDTRGHNLMTFKFPEKFGFLAGLEGPGLGGRWPLEQSLTIPMGPRVESLNAAASVAMALYGWRLSVRG